MKFIPPLAVTAAMLNSSVPETDYAAWSNVPTYALGARVVRLHRVYESAVAGNHDIDPAVATGSWLDVGPVNRWAMFDSATGSRTTAATTITVTLTPGVPIDAIGLAGVTAASVRVEISDGGPAIYDQTFTDPAAAMAVLDLPANAAPTITITVTPTGGTAAIGKLVIGNAVDLGGTETGPTINLTDYSRRDTSDFGVTTVVQRAWAKRVTMRARISSNEVDAAQRALAEIRAAPALWIGGEGFASLIAFGFYRDFSIDLQIGETSYCALTIEGLPEADIGGAVVEPAPEGASDFRVLRPLLVDDAVLTGSTIAENDYPAWSAITNYAKGVRVIKSATHRVYESAVGSNVGNDPATGAVQWFDVGPTNRTAMFDQALGSVSTKVTSF